MTLPFVVAFCTLSGSWLCIMEIFYNCCGRAETECIPRPADSHMPDLGWLCRWRVTVGKHQETIQICSHLCNWARPFSFSFPSNQVWSKPLFLMNHSELNQSFRGFFCNWRKWPNVLEVAPVCCWCCDFVLSVLYIYCPVWQQQTNPLS